MSTCVAAKVHTCYIARYITYVPPAINPENPLCNSHKHQRSSKLEKDESKIQSRVIHAVSLKYIHTAASRKTNFGMRGQKRIGRPENGKHAERRCNLRYNSTQSLQTTVWLVEKQRRCAAVTAIFYARFAAATEGAKEEPRLDTSIEDNPRSRRVAPFRAASVEQFANSRCSVEIYDAPEIFHYRFSWTHVALHGAHMYRDRNICSHVPHNTSRVCAMRVRARLELGSRTRDKCNNI